MGYVLAVDLGTTWTAAAVVVDGTATPLTLSGRGFAIPSVVARDGDGFAVGEAAERRLRTAPTSGAREMKRRLGDPAPFVLDGAPFGAEALLGQLVAAVVAQATADQGAAPDVVALSHPATWGDYKLDLLREAARVAGIGDIVLVPEPEAAAVHYAQLGRIAVGDVVAVYDFGGGTFDAAVLRRTEDGFEPLGSPQGLDRLGGIDVDQAVVAHVDRSLDGALATLDRGDPDVVGGLIRLREDCTRAKEALSSDTEVAVAVSVPGLDTQVRLTRAELEDMVRPRLAETVSALQAAVASAGLSMDDVATVLLVGGTSRMPIVAEHLTSVLGRPTAIDAHPKLAVALGAATHAAGAGDAVEPVLAMAGAGAGGSGGREKAAGEPASPEKGRRSAGGRVAAGAAAAAGVTAATAGAAAAFAGGGGEGGGDGEDDAIDGSISPEEARFLEEADDPAVAPDPVPAELPTEEAPPAAEPPSSLDAFDAVDAPAAPPAARAASAQPTRAPQPSRQDDDGPDPRPTSAPPRARAATDEPGSAPAEPVTVAEPVAPVMRSVAGTPDDDVAPVRRQAEPDTDATPPASSGSGAPAPAGPAAPPRPTAPPAADPPDAGAPADGPAPAGTAAGQDAPAPAAPAAGAPPRVPAAAAEDAAPAPAGGAPPAPPAPAAPAPAAPAPAAGAPPADAPPAPAAGAPPAPAGGAPPAPSAPPAPPPGAPPAPTGEGPPAGTPAPGGGDVPAAGAPAGAARPPAQAPAAPPPPGDDGPVMPRWTPSGNPQLDAARDQLWEAFQDGFTPPPGANPQQVAQLQRDVAGLIDRFQVPAGQTVQQAMAAHDLEVRDQIEDFTLMESNAALRAAEAAEQRQEEAARTVGKAAQDEVRIREQALAEAGEAYEPYREALLESVNAFDPEWAENLPPHAVEDLRERLTNRIEASGLSLADVNDVGSAQQRLREAVEAEIRQFQDRAFESQIYGLEEAARRATNDLFISREGGFDSPDEIARYEVVASQAQRALDAARAQVDADRTAPLLAEDPRLVPADYQVRYEYEHVPPTEAARMRLDDAARESSGGQYPNREIEEAATELDRAQNDLYSGMTQEAIDANAARYAAAQARLAEAEASFESWAEQFPNRDIALLTARTYDARQQLGELQQNDPAAATVIAQQEAELVRREAALARAEAAEFEEFAAQFPSPEVARATRELETVQRSIEAREAQLAELEANGPGFIQIIFPETERQAIAELQAEADRLQGVIGGAEPAAAVPPAAGVPATAMQGIVAGEHEVGERLQADRVADVFDETPGRAPAAADPVDPSEMGPPTVERPVFGDDDTTGERWGDIAHEDRTDPTPTAPPSDETPVPTVLQLPELDDEVLGRPLDAPTPAPVGAAPATPSAPVPSDSFDEDTLGTGAVEADVATVAGPPPATPPAPAPEAPTSAPPVPEAPAPPEAPEPVAGPEPAYEPPPADAAPAPEPEAEPDEPSSFDDGLP